MSFISLNLISLILVLLLTGFFSTQGAFSALLTLVMAVFSSILAMGVGGSVAGILPAMTNEYAQGFGFLTTFVAAFIALRVASDMLMPKNVPLPKWPDKIASGAVGLVASLVIIGTLVVGLEMLPFGTSIMGNGTIEDGQVGGRTLAGRFVTGMFYLTNGGSMGGKALASEHPDLGAEMTKKRHTVWADLRQTLAPDLIKVTAGFVVTPEKLKEQNIIVTKANDADKLLVIRTEVDKAAAGAKLDVTKPNADTSFDVGDTGYFDVTAAQVRMVAKGRDGKFREFNPIGFLDHGGKGSLIRKQKQTVFEPLSLDTGMLVEDYAETESAFKSVIEWVFEVPDDVDPQFIEVKRGGVAPLTKRDDGTDVIVSDKNYNALAADLYPPREDRSHQCALTIKLTEDGKPKKDATVWIVTPTVKRRIVSSLLNEGNSALEKNTDLDSGNQWPDPVSGGVPSRTELNSAHRAAINTVNKALDDLLPWEDVINVLYFGQAQRNGAQMVQFLKSYFAGPFSDMMNTADMAQSTMDKYTTDAKGSHAPTMVRPGDVLIIVVSPSAKAFRVWVIKETILPTETAKTIELPSAHQPTYETDTTKQ